MRRRQSAFTLVELLVVIVIIAILMALLLPAIARAIRRAQIRQCGNNINQLYKALFAMRTDRTRVTGTWPVPGDTLKDGTTIDAGSLYWTITMKPSALQAEIKDPRLADCPLGGANIDPNTMPPLACDYRGPAAAQNPNQWPEIRLLGRDKNGNHNEANTGDTINCVFLGGDTQAVMISEVTANVAWGDASLAD